MFAAVAVLLVLSLGPGCGGDDSSPGSVIPPGTCVDFTAAAAPAAGTVVARKNPTSSCDVLGIDLVVTDVSDIFAIELTVEYDQAVVSYDGVGTSGSLLSSDGAGLEVIDGGVGGRTSVSISRFGVVTGVDAVGSHVLATLIFRRPGAAGVSNLTVSSAVLFDSDAPPLPIAAQWFGGTFTVRLRPLHTNAVDLRLRRQRDLRRGLLLDAFWGWQLIIVSAAITLPLGITQGKEYAELEWPIDIAIAVVWVVFASTSSARSPSGASGTSTSRSGSTSPRSSPSPSCTSSTTWSSRSLLFKSYSIYAGVQDAFMQWWYGHNAVAFFLTTPFLGLMYYFLPKAANRPVFSYRCRSCTSGRWSSSTSGPGRTTCTTPRCRPGPPRWACCSR